jgi:CRISPR system Cascade subunit CasA
MPDAPDRSYDLLAERWVLVLTADGVAREVSLADVLLDAGSLRAIGGDVPTQSFAMLRLCLAVLHRALVDLTPTSPEDVPKAVEALDAHWADAVVPRVRAYLNRHRDRFDLFDPTAPFLQTPGMRTASGEFSSLAKIVVDVPNGAPYLAMRSARDLRRISAAESARWLVHAQAYDPSGIKTGVVGHPRAKGGKVYPEGVAWTGQLGGLHLVGDSVRTTLLLNLWARLPESDEALAADLPAWERPPLRVEELAPAVDRLDPARPSGPVDLYTWQSRCLLLRGDQTGVTGVLVSNADRFLLQERQDVARTHEPMSLWRFSKPQTAKYKRDIQMTRKHQPGTALWRGLANLVPPDAPGDRSETAGVVTHAALLHRSALLPDGLVHYRAISVEYGSNESVVDEIVEDSLDVPGSVLDPARAELRAVAVAAVVAARGGVDALRNLAGNLAAAAGGSGAALDGPRDRARDEAYAVLDPLYRTWLRSLARDFAEEPGLAERTWQRKAFRTLAELGDELVAQAPDKAWKGFGASSGRPDVGKVDAWFRSALAKAFPLARNDNRLEGAR